MSREADGAKRSGLTEPRTAGQFRVVMAGVHGTVAHVSELASRSWRAGWKKGRRRRRSAAAVRISERARAHLYERKYPAKPVNDCAVAMNAGLVASESCGALDICPGHALFVRTNTTSLLGVSDPPPTGPWGEEGGREKGVAHAPLIADGDADIGPEKDEGGIERRPATSREVQHRQRVPNRAMPLSAARRYAFRAARTALGVGGTVLPHWRSPRFLFALIILRVPSDTEKRAPLLRFATTAGRPAHSRARGLSEEYSCPDCRKTEASKRLPSTLSSPYGFGDGRRSELTRPASAESA